MDKKDVLKIVYQEIVDARKQQQEDVSLIYNKFNWMIVSNVVFLGFLFNFKKQNFFSFLSVIVFIISLSISLLSLKMKPFKRGPRLDDLIDASGKIESELLIKALNRKISDDIEKNKDIIKKFGEDLKLSINLLLSGVILIFIYYIFK